VRRRASLNARFATFYPDRTTSVARTIGRHSMIVVFFRSYLSKINHDHENPPLEASPVRPRALMAGADARVLMAVP
jgi:hypothetical protein